MQTVVLAAEVANRNPPNISTAKRCEPEINLINQVT